MSAAGTIHRFFKGDLVRIARLDPEDLGAARLLPCLGQTARVLETQEPDRYSLVPVLLDDGRSAEFWQDELADLTPSPQLSLLPEVALPIAQGVAA